MDCKENNSIKRNLYDRFMAINYETRLLGLFVAGLATLLSSFLYYAEHFGYSIDPNGTKGDWGTFGDFIGGTTNPILGFLALIGVIWSISHTQRQNKIISTFSVIELIHKEITNILNTKTVVRKGELGSLVEESIQLRDLPYRFQLKEEDKIHWIAIFNRVHYSITNLITLLIQMRVYLIKLEKQSNDKSESEFFKVNYYALVDLLYKTEQVMPKHIVEFYSERKLSYLSKEASNLISEQRSQ